MFQVQGIHQIEMTSQCNLRCRYCVHPHMPRPKMHMTDEVYRQSLLRTRELLARQTTKQPELNLAGIGESTMHPEFVRNVWLAREAVGWGVQLIIATNGLLMDEALAKAIAPAAPRVWVSLHRPEKAHAAVEALRSVGILSGVSIDPSVAAVDWAGQIKTVAVTTPLKGSRCTWVPRGMVFVMADGNVSRCCFDGQGSGVMGTVWDDFPADTAPYDLCAKCHLDVGVPMVAGVAA